MAGQCDEVLEGIDGVESAGVDKAHEEITHLGSPLGLVRERVLPVQDGHLQTPLADIVVQWGPGDAQEQSQGIPVVEQVIERTAESGVGFDFLLVDLVAQPTVEVVEDRLA